HRLLRSACRLFFSTSRRHTRLQGDWRSDVCSSDLLSLVKQDNGAANDTVNMRVAGLYCHVAGPASAKVFTGAYHIEGGTRKFAEIGRASCRETVERRAVGGAEQGERDSVAGVPEVE